MSLFKSADQSIPSYLWFSWEASGKARKLNVVRYFSERCCRMDPVPPPLPAKSSAFGQFHTIHTAAGAVGPATTSSSQSTSRTHLSGTAVFSKFCEHFYSREQAQTLSRRFSLPLGLRVQFSPPTEFSHPETVRRLAL